MEPRTYLGAAHGFAERVRVYWTGRALEVDHLEGYEIRRQRVLFDEVQLVTLHTKRGGMLPWLFLGLGAFVGLCSIGPILSEGDENFVGKGILAVALILCLLGSILYLLPIWVVTVFGRRTKARVHFRLRERKARNLYARICQAAAAAQRALQASAPVEQPGMSEAVEPSFPSPPPPLPDSDPLS
jgi:hypothetical protein